jgi:PAS domain S-box-containing protein
MIQPIHVLVIEQRASDVETMRTLLNSADEAPFVVESESTSAGGFARLVQGGIDIVLLGLDLPDASGLDALARLVGAAPEVPVVVMTGGEDRAKGLEAVRLGAQDFVLRGRAAASSLMRIVRYAIERKRAEETLRRSEERHRMLFNSINDAVFVHGLSDEGLPMRFTEVNDIACRRLGYSRDELLALGPMDIDGPEGLAVVPDMMARLQTEGFAAWEGVHVTKDGRSIPVEIGNRLFDMDGRPTILSTVHDITLRRQRDRDLREAHRKLNSLLNNLPGVFYRCANDPQWTMEYMSLGALELTGHAAEDFIGNRALSYAVIIDPDDRQRVREEIEQALAARQAFTLEYRIRTAKGDTKWVWERGSGIIADGQLVALEGFITDITERSLAIQALREAEEKYRHVVEHVSDGIGISNQEGRILFANPALARMVGVDDPDALVGRTVSEFVSLEVSEELQQRMFQDEARAGSFAEPIVERFPIRRQDGTEAILEVRASGSGSDGNGLILNGVIRDITQEVRAARVEAESHQRIRKALEGTILAMSRTVETRDPYTAGHQRRVAELARAIAVMMGMQDSRVEGLYYAGLVHDVGKIGLPAEILSKPSKLTSTEFQLIQSHSALGADIIGDIDFPWPIATMVRQHHERLDGTGYPDRLPGTEILLESLILAVADVVEAMVSDRPYRPGLGVGVALAEILAGSGTRYDADVVAACVHVVRDQEWRFD